MFSKQPHTVSSLLIQKYFISSPSFSTELEVTVDKQGRQNGDAHLLIMVLSCMFWDLEMARMVKGLPQGTSHNNTSLRQKLCVRTIIFISNIIKMYLFPYQRP